MAKFIRYDFLGRDLLTYLRVLATLYLLHIPFAAPTGLNCMVMKKPESNFHDRPEQTLLLANRRDSFQLFVGVFDTCLVWYLLVLPSEKHAVANMTYLRAIDGDTSYH